LFHRVGAYVHSTGLNQVDGTSLVRSKTIIMIALALFFGTGAIFAARNWAARQSSERTPIVEVAPKPLSTDTVVVAALPFRFGTELTKQHLREVAWPAGTAPTGAFSKIEEVLDGRTRRIALAAVVENEPLLKTKITGPGQRASLSALISPDMKAVTVRVNDVNGVAGFVLPGERVDILLTRSLDKGQGYADVLLQNVNVLAVDQLADDHADKPALVKAVTLEVNTAQAQKLSLATNVGSLSLVLRAAGAAQVETTQRIAVTDLSQFEEPVPQVAVVTNTPAVAAARPGAPEVSRTVAVGVTRGMKRDEYSVPRQGTVEIRDIVTGSTTPHR
jgi:pilus assembly protein CpaB